MNYHFESKQELTEWFESNVSEIAESHEKATNAYGGDAEIHISIGESVLYCNNISGLCEIEWRDWPMTAAYTLITASN